MSTLDTRTTTRGLAPSQVESSELPSLASLVETLARLDRRPELAEVDEWMSRVRVGTE